MPTPKQPLIVAAKATNLANMYVTFKNLTRSGKETVKANSSGEAKFSAPRTWVAGDVIQISVAGKYTETKQVTIGTTGGVLTTLSASSEDTTTKGIDM